MKKYKLIKKLPFEFSPEVGYISPPTYPKREPDVHYILGQPFIPKDHPEFWEEVIEKPELCVPVGTRFKHKIGSDVYTINLLRDNTVTLFLSNGGKVSYPVSTVNNYFKNGYWIVCYPIFKTEDGREIFEGDEYWHVSPNWDIKKGGCTKEFKPLEGYKRFSNEWSARNYVKMNMPIYSRNDIISRCSSLQGILSIL